MHKAKMYGEEYYFKGSVAKFVAVVETYSHRVIYRASVIPGPYAPMDTFTRLVPSTKDFRADITYAEFTFKSRFTKYTGEIYANPLPSGKTLVVMVFPNTNFEDEYAEQSLHWAWQGLESYLIGHGWIEGKDTELAKQPHPSALLERLVRRCSEGEIQTFCLQLDVGYESLPGSGKEYKTRELVIYLGRRERISDLVALIKKDRPDISLDTVQ
jgi:hypothetical protein